jgi:uncharacterized protein YraI
MKRLVLAIVVTLCAAALRPANAASGEAMWLAEFYDNLYLIGDGVDRTVNAVSFDWGAGAPAPGIGADNFSARFTTSTQFAAGTYRFFARADDEIRVTVDSQTIIDTLDNPRVGDVLSADVTLGGGTHRVRVEYRERTGDAYVFLSWENAAGNPIAPNFPPLTSTTESTVDLGPWIVQFFGNQALSGFPSGIFSVSEISQDWGEGSPLVNIPTDGFSARWTTSTALDQGVYRVTARADDGVRVFVDGQQIIDLWVNAVGRTGSQDITLAGGQHTFVVEYYEDGGDAYIEFDVTRVLETQIVPTPVPAVKVPSTAPQQTNATGTVDAYRLNVRAAPTTDAQIVTKIERGETYPIIGRNADDSWWQIRANGTVGWVFADFIVPSNTANVPVTSTSRTTPPDDVTATGLTLTATATVNLRSAPSRAGAVLGLLPRGAQAEILGRNSTGTWIEVNYNGTVAWVSRAFVDLPVSANELPVSR